MKTRSPPGKLSESSGRGGRERRASGGLWWEEWFFLRVLASPAGLCVLSQAQCSVCVCGFVCEHARVCVSIGMAPFFVLHLLSSVWKWHTRKALAQGPKSPLQSSLPTVSCSGRPRLCEASLCGECVLLCVLCSGRRGWDQRRALDQMFQVFILRGI